MTGSEHSGRRTALILALAVVTSPLFGGCALLVGGAMAGTAMVVSDRRTSGTQLEDQAIELKAVSRVRETLGDKGHVNVTSYNKLVLLTGEVPNEADKAALEQTIGRIENVRSVVNELAVIPSSSIGNRSNDAFVTSKVRASIVDAKDLMTGAFKVVTERSTVYLMGRVTEREANRVADVARGVSGVQKVVRVFEIVTEAELAGTQPSPAPAPAK